MTTKAERATERIRNRCYPPDGVWFDTSWVKDIESILNELMDEAIDDYVMEQ